MAFKCLGSECIHRAAEEQQELWEKIFQLLFKSLAVAADEVVDVAKAGLRVSGACARVLCIAVHFLSDFVN